MQSASAFPYATQPFLLYFLLSESLIAFLFNIWDVIRSLVPLKRSLDLVDDLKIKKEKKSCISSPCISITSW